MGEVHPYISEGFGEDFVPQNYDMSVIDYFEQVTDKDGAVMARRLFLSEGTVRNHLSAAIGKTGATNRAGAVAAAESHGWL